MWLSRLRTACPAILAVLFVAGPIMAQERLPYDGKKAAEYARKWALAENPDYKKFDSDCTNFVSQALHAGGWKMIQSTVFGRKDDDVWWYGGTIVDASYTWGGAENLAKFFKTSGRAESVTDPSRLTVGDVVQIKNESGKLYHTMIVTGQSEGDLLLSYHTKNHLDEPLSRIRERTPRSHTFIYWKVLYSE